jgi:hypothetical protein
MKRLYAKEDVLGALEAIVNSVSRRKTSLDYRVLRTTLFD